MRLKAFDISPRSLFELFKRINGVNVIVDGLPEDSQFRGFCHSVEKNCIVMFVESSEFEEVPEGERCPSGNLTITVTPIEEMGFLPSFVDDEGKIHD